MLSTPRPSQLHKLALLFPSDTKSPQFRWIEFEHLQVGAKSWQVPLLKSDLGPASSDGEVHFKHYDVSSHLQKKFPGNQRYELDHTVAVHIRQDWGNDGSKLNQSIDKIMNGSQPIKWKGPMLA